MRNDKSYARKGVIKNRLKSVGRLLSLSFIICHLSLGLAFGQTQKGVASYYTKSWTGRLTASGERLHHDSMTCAHLKHPFGTMLKVTCPSTDKVVFVRVTDRGPYHKRRIIDLSWGAARDLGILSKGIAEVIVEVCTPVVHLKEKEVPSAKLIVPWDSLANVPLLPWAP